MPINDFTPITPGMIFGRLTVIREGTPYLDKRPNRGTLMPRWLCSCTCGGEVEARQEHLLWGRTRSCGCLRKEVTRERGQAASSHNGVLHGESSDGESPSPEYRHWRCMIQRCENKNSPDYYLYGGRGINVCKRWRHSYKAFLSDMGRKPSLRHSLDRFPDCNGDYSPDNCRWATPLEQSRNKRNNVLVTLGGTTHCIAEWAEILGISRSCIAHRIRRGLPPEKVLAPAAHFRKLSLIHG